MNQQYIDNISSHGSQRLMHTFVNVRAELCRNASRVRLRDGQRQ